MVKWCMSHEKMLHCCLCWFSVVMLLDDYFISVVKVVSHNNTTIYHLKRNNLHTSCTTGWSYRQILFLNSNRFILLDWQNADVSQYYRKFNRLHKDIRMIVIDFCKKQMDLSSCDRGLVVELSFHLKRLHSFKNENKKFHLFNKKKNLLSPNNPLDQQYVIPCY